MRSLNVLWAFYLWKKKYAGLGLNELGRLREENANLKRLVTDLSMDRHILQEIVAKELEGHVRGANWRSGCSRCIDSALIAIRRSDPSHT